MRTCLRTSVLVMLVTALPGFSYNAAGETWAERLGWPEGAKVVIFHIDDAGMSHSANLGTIKAMTEGIATSCSIMMPCPWVSGYYAWLKDYPETDAGLHLTLTCEWENYRWGPLAGQAAVPGLADKEGCMWESVEKTARHATPDEVAAEIRAQIDRAETMGIDYTHIDSHMGTLFHPKFIQRYVDASLACGKPALLPAGHMYYISLESPVPANVIRKMAQQIWDAGMPVIDDVFAATYDWKTEDKTEKFIEILEGMKPGILEIILHCTIPTEVFPVFSGSSVTRKGDLNAMLDPRLKQYIEDEGIELTTWRELNRRRAAIKD
jgi:chitin disaccharide deacetylase